MRLSEDTLSTRLGEKGPGPQARKRGPDRGHPTRRVSGGASSNCVRCSEAPGRPYVRSSENKPIENVLAICPEVPKGSWHRRLLRNRAATRNKEAVSGRGDGLPGLRPDGLGSYFPKTRFVTCLVMVLRTFLFESAFTAALRTVGLLMSFMAIAFFTVLCLPVDLYLRGLLELAAKLPVQQ